MAEMIDIYDDNREFTGVTLPRKTKLTKGQFMLYVIALIQNDNGEFLVTQRTMDKKWAAGHWEIPGGGVAAGETSFDAVCREVFEETGLDVKDCDAEVIYSYKNEDLERGDNYFTDIYLVHKDFSLSDIHVEEDEVNDVKLADFDEITRLNEEIGFLHYKRICEALKK